MKTHLCLIMAALYSLLSLAPASGQGTAFTYQGRLTAAGNPANGLYDLTFTLYGMPTGGTALTSGITNAAVPVTNGLFTATIDFGGSPSGELIWLELGVRSNATGIFTQLAPRQQLTPSPYAMFAITASNLIGSLSTTQLNGVLPSVQLSGAYSGAVTLNNSGNSFGGNFIGNGAGLTNVNAAALGGLAMSNFWQLGGNNVSANQFFGSTNNQALEIRVRGLRALRLEPASNGAPNVIGGSPLNVVDAGVIGATIGGGGATNYPFAGPLTNRISSNLGVIAGGAGNLIQTNSEASAISGGEYNEINGAAGESAIVGGTGNLIDQGGDLSFIGGGSENYIQAEAAAVLAGAVNQVRTNSNFGIIVGGKLNSMTNAVRSFIGNGAGSEIDSWDSFIGAGLFNNVSDGSPNSLIGGGDNNKVGIHSTNSVITGGHFNMILDGNNYATVGGGENNLVASRDSVIAGGSGNVITNGSHGAAIAGGEFNTINYLANDSAIVGGTGNLIDLGGDVSFIGGGSENYLQSEAAGILAGTANQIRSNSNLAIIVGGKFNSMTNAVRSFIGNGVGCEIDSWDSCIGAGVVNNISDSTPHSVIVGGDSNQIEPRSTNAFIGGGSANLILTNSPYTTIGGGQLNQALGIYATLPGGWSNSASAYSFAAGSRALATNSGAFVWADHSTNGLVFSTNNNSVTFRAAGGYRLFSNTNSTSGAFLAPGGTSWTVISDRHAKKGFVALNVEDVLNKLVQIPVSSWHYQWESDSDTPNIGPMAQDFKSVFYPGRDDTGITTLEFDGVELAAIQGLNQKLQESLQEKDREIEDLKTRLERLEKLVASRSSP